MSTEERKAFVRRQIEELWNKGNLEAAEECFTSEFVGHDPASLEEIRAQKGSNKTSPRFVRPSPISTCK
jgi:hypothetical protein